MQDKSLSPYAKAIYSYLKSYCGNKNECFPSVAKICYDVGINRCTYDKYIKQLVGHGYVKKRRDKRNGKFDRNIYTVCEFIDDKSTGVGDTGNGGANAEKTVNGKDATNNNRINKNKFNKNTLNMCESKETKISGYIPLHTKSSIYDDFDLEEVYEKP